MLDLILKIFIYLKTEEAFVSLCKVYSGLIWDMLTQYRIHTDKVY